MRTGSSYGEGGDHDHIPQTVLALRGSYLSCRVILMEIAKAGRQVPKPRCLSPAANSLKSRIAGRRPRYLSLGTQAQLPIA